MQNIRLLYLVQHTNKEMFKIGIATDNTRFTQLNEDYQIDWTSSLYFKGEETDIVHMEKILHRLFHKYRLDKQNGTGGTEWFSSDCLETVVESILFNVENTGFSIDLEFVNIDISKVPTITECKSKNNNQHIKFDAHVKQYKNYLKYTALNKRKSYFLSNITFADEYLNYDNNNGCTRIT